MAAPVRDRARHIARQVKHRAFLAWKFKHLHLRHLEPFREAWQRRRPLPLEPDLLTTTFLARDLPDEHDPHATVPRVLWCIWAGENPLSPARQASLARIRAVQTGLEVRLVTPANLAEHVLPEAPLHPAYEHLSLVHRSDYLRGYLLHHHGGAYTDVKRPLHAWDGVLEDFERGGYWFAGYPEIVRTLIPEPEPFGNAMRRRSHLITGQGAFLARPRTPFTGEWIAEMHARLDAAAPALEAHPGDVYGTSPGYPLGWVDLLATITEPLEVKYAAHVLRDRRLRVDVRGYR